MSLASRASGATLAMKRARATRNSWRHMPGTIAATGGSTALRVVVRLLGCFVEHQASVVPHDALRAGSVRLALNCPRGWRRFVRLGGARRPRTGPELRIIHGNITEFRAWIGCSSRARSAAGRELAGRHTRLAPGSAQREHALARSLRVPRFGGVRDES